MIASFLSSKFSGYIAIAGVIVVLGLVWYIYNEGKTSCQNQVKSDQLDDIIEVKRNTQNVKKKEQSLDDVAIDRALCRIGIVRGHNGCE